MIGRFASYWRPARAQTCMDLAGAVVFALSAGCNSPPEPNEPTAVLSPAPMDPDGPTLPDSLDAYYPPKASGPIYHQAMHGLARPLEGLVADVLQDDFDGARANHDAFSRAYAEVAAMVPEWRQAYPSEPVEALGRVLERSDRNAILEAVDRVGAVCHTCHVTAMPQAYFKYHWPRFTAISAVDPLSNQPMGYAPLMRALSTSFTGIGNDLQQGQVVAARQNLAAFKVRFELMRDTCNGCHDSGRTYYVGEVVTRRIEDLEASLASEHPDAEAAQRAMMEIGKESCVKCHLVHIPAAYADSAGHGYGSRTARKSRDGKD